jgi:FKBP-type peptidyl-prolyl cis-trans isomerase (trigger factor)
LCATSAKLRRNCSTAFWRAVDFEPPPSLVGICRKIYLLQARVYFESQGLLAGEVMQKLEELTPEAESSARGQAKAQAFLMALAYREKLVLSQEELKQEIEKMARQNRCDAAKLEADLYSNNAVYELQDQLLADKALRYFYTKARKIVIGEDGNELSCR